MRSFAARLPNLLLFLAFIAYPTRSAAGLPAEAAQLPAGGATRALRCGAPRRLNGHLPPFSRRFWPFDDSGLDLAAVA
jgi:hypothetical protein